MNPDTPPCRILFDWGDTLMRVFNYPGKMKDWHRLEVIPGAPEMLNVLNGRVRLELATNAADSEELDIREALERVGLAAFFQRVYCYRNVGHKKSSPPFFSHVLGDLKFPPDRVVMVGDDFRQDVEAALACGMKAVWFNEHGAESPSGPGFSTIHALMELPDLLGAWRMLPP